MKNLICFYYSGTLKPNRLVFQEKPDSRKETPETSQEKLSQAEVLRRTEDIKKYFQLAYEDVPRDFNEAAKEANFTDRRQADKYLSQLTGAQYGPHLKSGDKLISPDGQEMTYYATSQETLNVIQQMDNFPGKDLMVLKLTAHAYAEKLHFKLDVRTLTAPIIYSDIVKYKVLEMRENSTIMTQSGVMFTKQKGGSIYYNTNPNQDNTWGRLDGGNKYFIPYERNFLEVTKNDHYGMDGRTIFIYESGGKKLGFDERGRFDNRLTQELSQ